MVIGTKKLLELVKTQNLIEGLSERELTNPEGTGFDLRLGAVHKLTGTKAFLGVEERGTPEMQKIAEHGKDKSFTLMPGEYVITETIEKINTPDDMLALFRPRGTLYRSGVMLYTGNCSPGYAGKLFFGMKNHGTVPLTIELGARFVHVMFYAIQGDIAQRYRGQWQHGINSTQGVIEKQV